MDAIVETIDYNIHSFSSEELNWPASNIKNFRKQFNYWKTTDLNDNWVIVDLLAPKQVNAVVLLNVNYNTVNLQFNDTTNFTTPAVETGNLTLFKDLITGRYRLFINPQDYGSVNHRYIRIFTTAQSALDGDTGLKTGGVAISDSSEKFLENPLFGMPVTPSKPTESRRMLSGADEKISRGNRMALLNMSKDVFRNKAEFTQFAKQFIEIEQTNPIIIHFGKAFHEDDINGQYVFVFERNNDFEYALDDFSTAKATNINLKETV